MECLQCVVLVLVFSTAALGQGFEGDKCSIDGGGTGMCTNIDSCPKVKADLAAGKSPIICSFSGFSPIVCCPLSSTRPPVTPKPQVPSVRKATQKCTEYAEHVWRYENPPTLQIFSKPVKIDQCFQSGQINVIGGEEAKGKEFPHMALIGFGEKNDISWWCGGTLISPRFVLTAGHCLSGKSKGSARWVRLGELNLKQKNEDASPQDFEIVERIPHPDYKPPASYNDIALLKLEKDVEMNEFIRPACLHTEDAISDKNGIATGWGLTQWSNSEGSDHLMKVALPLQSTATCNTAYKSLTTTSRLRNGISDSSMICAGYMEGGKDTCKGDSGSPLQLLMTTPYCMYDVIGLTSFGKTLCGSKNSPAVYTRVSNYVPWIEKIVWP